MPVPGGLTRRRFLEASAGAAVTAAIDPAAFARTPDGPNVVLFVVDSLRADAVYDNWVRTPNMDALRRRGVSFTNVYPEAMPTVPARNSILGGRRMFPFRGWHDRRGLIAAPGWSPLTHVDAALTSAFRNGGYYTAYVTDNPFLVGPRFERFRGTLDTVKPIYDQGEYRVWNIGVDKNKVATRAQIENYLLPALQGTEAETRIKENVGFNKGRSGDQLSGARTLKAGMDVLRQLKDKQPFFLGVDAFDPHEAWNVPTAFKLRFPHREGVEPILPFKTPNSTVESLDVTDEQIEHVRELYAGELTYIDSWIGRLLNLLDDLGLAENTVVYYLSDHGILLGEHGRLGKDGSMLGKEIHSVPYMIRHPRGRRAGDTTDYFASTHDVAPTILSFQGLTVPGRMDGEDLTVMFDDADPPARDYWTTAYSANVAAGDGRWLLIADNQGKERRLFDTEDNPSEDNDVADAHPDVVDRLWQNIVNDAGGTMPVFGKTGVVSG